MKKSKTGRGFSLFKFVDRYGQKCSLQKSSIATEDCVWLGLDDPDPKVLARDAEKYGVKTSETTGWVPYPIPEDVLISTRMHLSIQQVKELLPILTKFVKTGEI